MTRKKQPMWIGTNRMCISRDDNCANTMCFPRQLQENSLRRYAFVAFFDVCDTSCPIGKLPFSLLLCDEFLKTYFLSMPQLSNYVSIRPNERFRKVLQSWRSRYLAPRESPCCNFATALLYLKMLFTKLLSLLKCLTQADIKSILFTSPPICITYDRRSKVVENVRQ